MRRLFAPVMLSVLCLLAAGCDQLGIESATALLAKKEADGKATGGACRHAGRAIEDCYTLNKKTDKAAMYAGWREMSEYMRDNKLEPVAPLILPGPPKPAPESAPAEGDAADEPADVKPGARAKSH